ncbi:L-lactate permease [Anaerotignum sp. MB30-C6]|uniref:L-lactate permease n=1 Tax=Anaerotignum sp. MB30-C6 TaxID=3070814 RepID=UPI0027DBD40A|nr:L-lactate permease [Anaerotignum sp. MB30-C6]WMI81219.1 L-lactate permease [Anaerotignum sp. MB30-C6]
MMDFVMAISPLVLILVGIIVLKMPAMKVAPLGLLYIIILALTYFSPADVTFQDTVSMIDGLLWKGIKEGAKIVMLVFSSFLLLNLMQRSGAMKQVQNTLADVTDDRRAQLIIVGLMVPIFLEGAAGAGSPAAIAAPFLVGLGFDPIVAIVIALLGDATPCSWGGAGLTTITGGAYLVDQGISSAALNSAMVGRIHMFGVFIIPFLIVMIAFGKKGFQGIIPYLFFSGLSTGLIMFVLSNFVGPEITSLGTGLLSIVYSVVYLKFVKIKTPEAYRYKGGSISAEKEGQTRRYSSFHALSPYLVLLIALPVVRYTVPFTTLITFGYIVWVDVVVFLCACIGCVILGVSMEGFFDTMKQTAVRVLPVLVTMGSLLTVSYVMQHSQTGMIQMIASTIADAAGQFYPAAAVAIGSAGSFITGTGLGSNIMFAPMHLNATSMLGLNPITVFAGQNAGASLGNLICPNNVVAACATVGVIGREGEVLKRTFAAFAVILSVYMLLSMVYTHMLFPNFGL